MLKFIQVVKNEINAQFPDNSTGLITPATLRGVVQDMTDSLYARFASLFGDLAAVPVVQALTTTPTNYPNLYTTTLALDPAVLAANLAAGTITEQVTGFYNALEGLFVVSGANNLTVSGVIAKNGVPLTRSTFSATMTGAGNQVTGSIVIPLIGVVTSDVFTLLLSSESPTPVTFHGILMRVSVLPTFSAV